VPSILAKYLLHSVLPPPGLEQRSGPLVGGKGLSEVGKCLGYMGRKTH
jgi:hypothetical protein